MQKDSGSPMTLHSGMCSRVDEVDVESFLCMGKLRLTRMYSFMTGCFASHFGCYMSCRM